MSENTQMNPTTPSSTETKTVPCVCAALDAKQKCGKDIPLSEAKTPNKGVLETIVSKFAKDAGNPSAILARRLLKEGAVAMNPECPAVEVVKNLLVAAVKGTKVAERPVFLDLAYILRKQDEAKATKKAPQQLDKDAVRRMEEQRRRYREAQHNALAALGIDATAEAAASKSSQAERERAKKAEDLFADRLLSGYEPTHVLDELYGGLNLASVDEKSHFSCVFGESKLVEGRFPLCKVSGLAFTTNTIRVFDKKAKAMVEKTVPLLKVGYVQTTLYTREVDGEGRPIKAKNGRGNDITPWKPVVVCHHHGELLRRLSRPVQKKGGAPDEMVPSFSHFPLASAVERAQEKELGIFAASDDGEPATTVPALKASIALHVEEPALVMKPSRKERRKTKKAPKREPVVSEEVLIEDAEEIGVATTPAALTDDEPFFIEEE